MSEKRSYLHLVMFLSYVFALIYNNFQEASIRSQQQSKSFFFFPQMAYKF